MSVHRKLELAANAAILLVAGLITWVIVAKFTGARDTKVDPGLRQREAAALRAGTRMALSPVDWRANKRTLIMAVMRDCTSCTESAAFHRRVAARARETGVQLIALLPDRQPDGAAYVRTIGLEITDVRQVNMKDLAIARVPALIVVNDRGTVERAWLGRLAPTQQEEVFRTIAQGSEAGG